MRSARSAKHVNTFIERIPRDGAGHFQLLRPAQPSRPGPPTSMAEKSNQGWRASRTRSPRSPPRCRMSATAVEVASNAEQTAGSSPQLLQQLRAWQTGDRPQPALHHRSRHPGGAGLQHHSGDWRRTPRRSTPSSSTIQGIAEQTNLLGAQRRHRGRAGPVNRAAVSRWWPTKCACCHSVPTARPSRSAA